MHRSVREEGQPFEQSGSEPLFEHPDLLADGSLRHVEFERSAREAKVSCRRFECAQGVQRKMRTDGGHDISFSLPKQKLCSLVDGSQRDDILLGVEYVRR
jgi:hypothetical protein